MGSSPNPAPPPQERVYRKIRARIIACQLQSGVMLKEAEVAAMLHLGRTRVRQAFGRLRADGLVVVRPRSGVEVRDFEQRDLLEIVEARLVNEAHAAGLAALRVTHADLARPEEIVLESTAATAVSETPRLMLLDHIFHERIADLSGNTVLAGILRNLRDRAIRLWLIAAGGGDCMATEAAMNRHVDDFRTSVQCQPNLR